MTTLVSQPGQLRGVVQMPGDKSISHRALLLGAVAEGTSEVSGFLEAEDCLATLSAMRALGVSIEQPAVNQLRIHGVGLRGLRAPQQPLDLGNSGTAMRLMLGLLAAQDFDSELVGDASLSTRPMERVLEPLSAMGASIESNGGCAPLRINGQHRLRGIDYRLPMASAQLKSCLLLAGLYASGETIVRNALGTRDHTERMLKGFGYPIQFDAAESRLHGGGALHAQHISVPGDFSSASFFIAAASLATGSDIRLLNVGLNPSRTGLLQILQSMGACIEVLNQRRSGGELIADLRIRSARLRGIEVPLELVPLAIDELPILLVVASMAQGDTVVRGAAELRVKESDRLASMAAGFAALGIDFIEHADGMEIRGPQMPRGGIVDSFGDHRIAMAFAVAALMAEHAIEIRNAQNIATSFPQFTTLMNALGASMSIAQE